MSRRIVLDTNCLLQAISRRSRFYPIWREFVQCAIVANAEYIVTDDSHFDVLKDIPFPRVLVMTAEAFLADLESA